MTRRMFMKKGALQGSLLSIFIATGTIGFAQDSKPEKTRAMDIITRDGVQYCMMGPLYLAYNINTKDFVVKSNDKIFLTRETTPSGVKETVIAGVKEQLADGSFKVSYEDISVVCGKQNGGIDVYLDGSDVITNLGSEM